MSSLNIISPGLLTTVQDNGRYGWLKYGVPISGAMDTYSLMLANILVNNQPYEAALEMTAAGLAVEFDGTMAIALTGADMSPILNGNNIEMYKTIYVNKGDVLSFGSLKSGFRTYMSVSGGFTLPSVMGSKATYLRGGFGGFKGRKLQAGDILEVNKDFQLKYFGEKSIPEDMIPRYKNEFIARVIMGPENDRFKEEGINSFLSSRYKVSNLSDRMGVRLQGKQITHLNGADIISGPVTHGSIQVPSDGQPIILTADCQSTGGYTKIAAVISIDLPYIAQLKPDDLVSFKNIDVSEAQKLFIEREKRLEMLAAEFKKQKDVNLIGNVRTFSVKISDELFNVSLQEIE